VWKEKLIFYLCKEPDKFQFDEEVLYMKKSISRIIGVIMLIVAFVFIMFALNHPEKGILTSCYSTWCRYPFCISSIIAT